MRQNKICDLGLEGIDANFSEITKSILIDSVEYSKIYLEQISKLKN